MESNWVIKSCSRWHWWTHDGTVKDMFKGTVNCLWAWCQFPEQREWIWMKNREAEEKWEQAEMQMYLFCVTLGNKKCITQDNLTSNLWNVYYNIWMHSIRSSCPSIDYWKRWEWLFPKFWCFYFKVSLMLYMLRKTTSYYIPSTFHTCSGGQPQNTAAYLGENCARFSAGSNKLELLKFMITAYVAQYNEKGKSLLKCPFRIYTP